MARDKDPPFQRSGKDDPEGWLEDVVADEDGADKVIYWRLSAWGFAAAAAVALGVIANKSAIDPRAAETSARYFESKTAQVETVSREAQFEARRLASAIETLNSDRDRIYARLSTVEQGFESVTGSIRASDAAPAKATAKPVEQPAPAAAAQTTPALPTPSPDMPKDSQAVSIPSDSQGVVGPTSSIEAVPDVWAVNESQRPIDAPVPATEFGIDLGASGSVDGLRSIWRTTSSIHKAALAGLIPIVAIQERGPKQPPLLRLVAGPLRNAADAARLCVLLMEKAKDCKTTVFDGQKLQVSAEAPSQPQPKRPPNRVPKQSPRPVAPGGSSAVVPAPAQVSVLPSFMSGQ